MRQKTSNAGRKPINVPALTATGISRLEVFSNNSVTVPTGSPVALPTGGRLTVAAGAVSVNADISVPAARSETFVRTATPSVTSSGIDLTANQIGDAQSGSTGAMSIRNARIDASGQWAVDTRQPGGLEQPAYLVNAGSVRLQGYRDFVADAASQIDVSAGAYLSPTRRLSTGAAGSVQVGLNTTDSLRDPSIALTAQFDATIRGFGFASGASFKARAADVLVSDVRPADYQGLWLQAGRFAGTLFALTDNGRLCVIDPVTSTLVDDGLNLGCHHGHRFGRPLGPGQLHRDTALECGRHQA
jgi:hypothetical protein